MPVIPSSLAHLPQNKQDQLHALIQIVIAKVPAEMIILFGSYARGDWVENYQEKYEYVRDFDILIVTKDKKSAKQIKKSRELEPGRRGADELMTNHEITRTSIIYHSIGFVNDKIERNYYFFVDIPKEGIMLFDSGKFSLSEPKELDTAQRVEKSTEEFEHWFESALHFLEAYEIFVTKGEADIDYFKISISTSSSHRKILFSDSAGLHRL